MVTKTKMLGLVLATAVVFNAPMLVWADNGDVKPATQHDHEHMMVKVLNLTADQEKQLKDSHQKQKEAMKGIFEQMKSNREAFDTEIVKATPDMNKINDIQAQLKTIQSQMVDNHLNSLLGVRKILTPEQFVGFMTLQKERKMKHMGHKFGHKHGDDQGDKDHNPDSQE